VGEWQGVLQRELIYHAGQHPLNTRRGLVCPILTIGWGVTPALTGGQVVHTDRLSGAQGVVVLLGEPDSGWIDGHDSALRVQHGDLRGQGLKHRLGQLISGSRGWWRVCVVRRHGILQNGPSLCPMRARDCPCSWGAVMRGEK